jgi:hypothetical protein
VPKRAFLRSQLFGIKTIKFLRHEVGIRVDILMSIPGIKFEDAWKNREVVQLGNLKLLFISRSDLIHSKEASGRPQDKIDLEKLKEGEQMDALDKT